MYKQYPARPAKRAHFPPSIATTGFEISSEANAYTKNRVPLPHAPLVIPNSEDA
jgi:hypothetical protein